MRMLLKVILNENAQKFLRVKLLENKTCNTIFFGLVKCYWVNDMGLGPI